MTSWQVGMLAIPSLAMSLWNVQDCEGGDSQMTSAKSIVVSPKCPWSVGGGRNEGNLGYPISSPGM